MAISTKTIERPSISKKIDNLLRTKFLIALLFISTLIILLISFSPTVPFKTSDAMGSLLTAESIIEHGTVKLDSYKGKIDFYTWQIKEKNGHLYYVFPIGNSLFALPFMGLSKLVRMRMTKFEDEIKLQRVMSALTVVCSFVLVLLIARCFLDYSLSFLFSLIFLFGSSLMSTMGSAFWNQNTTVLLILLCLLHITHYVTGKIERLNPYLLGFLLGFSFLCRPTAVIFIAFVFTYILISQKSVFLKTSLVTGVVILSFVGFSLLEYGQILPDYYLPQRLGGTNIFSNLYGCLISPARGLLVHSPFLIVLLFFMMPLLFRSLTRSQKTLLILAFGWFALHLLAVGSFSHWWGGGGFGPRLFTDSFPSLILIAVLIWSEAQKKIALSLRNGILTTFIILAIPSVYINTYSGLFNETIPIWNDNAFYDRFPEYLYNWSYPPFLATPKLMSKRDIEIYTRYPPILLVEDIIYLKNGEMTTRPYKALDQFGTNVWRLLKGILTEIVFTVDLSEVRNERQLQVEMFVHKTSKKRIRVILNGRRIGVMPRGTHDHSALFTFPVKTKFLKKINTLRFEQPPPKNSKANKPIMCINIRSIRITNPNQESLNL